MTAVRHPGRPRALSVALAVIGLWALVLVPVLGRHHRATHVHVTCDHGEQIDLGERDHGVAAAIAALDAAGRGAAAGQGAALDAIGDGGGTTGTEEGHHHCALGCPLAAAIHTAPAALAVAAAPPPPLVLARAPIAAPRAVAILADAPKTSPPA